MQQATRTRVKICGITRAEDAAVAAEYGADAIGLVFHSGSPRAVDIGRAQAIARVLPPFVTVVGLFVNAEHFVIEEVLCHVRIDVLQFHGDESPADCGGYGRPYIKAVPMRGAVELQELEDRYSDASALLLDTYSPAGGGGTGKTFEWSWVPRNANKPIILAGGLTPRNVGDAIRAVRPYAVDVSSGVEVAKGIKDVDKVAAFMRAVASSRRD